MQPIERNGLISLLFLICAGTAFFLSDAASDGKSGVPAPPAGKVGQGTPQRGSPQLDGLPAVAQGGTQRPQRSDLPRAGGAPRGNSTPQSPAAGPAGAGAANPAAGATQPAPRSDLAAAAQLGAEERLVAGQPSRFTPLGNSAPQGPVLVGGAGRLAEGGASAEIPRLGGLQATPPGSVPSGGAPAGLAQAGNAGPAPLPTYTVQKGDTLSEISQKLLSSSKRSKLILAVNPGLNPDRLQAGQVIKLPSNEMLLAEAAAQKQASSAASSAVAGNPSAATGAVVANAPANGNQGSPAAASAGAANPARPNGAGTPAPEARGPVHVVAKGENLWSIAERRLGDGNRYREIEALNPEVRGRPLAVGQQLRLPDGSAPVARANSGASEAPAPRTQPKPATKPVRRVR
jgi:nucleoid-associated protein YgaU